MNLDEAPLLACDGICTVGRTPGDKRNLLSVIPPGTPYLSGLIHFY